MIALQASHKGALRTPSREPLTLCALPLAFLGCELELYVPQNRAGSGVAIVRGDDNQRPTLPFSESGRAKKVQD